MSAGARATSWYRCCRTVQRCPQNSRRPAAPSAEQPPSAEPDFDTVFRQVREIGGWLTEAQAATLWQRGARRARRAA